MSRNQRNLRKISLDLLGRGIYKRGAGGKREKGSGEVCG
jgi:hypothetical protein